MMPVSLFDKSFLQSLSVDEAVWFDHYFTANVCPLFYVETLADIEKPARTGRSPEWEVATIAEKFPQMHGSPNVYHQQLCIGNLMGQPIPMDGQIVLGGGKPVTLDGESGVVFGHTPEAEAFSRWSEGRFLDVEKSFARDWRESLATLDLGAMGNTFRALGVDGRSCRTLEEAHALASAIACGEDKPFDRMKLAVIFFGIPERMHRRLLERWNTAGYAPLSRYAPYAAFVLTIELFFQIAIASHLISSERPSNRIDIGYLFYLPFCDFFVSTDKLHQRCAPLFLRPGQDFVFGNTLKDALKQVHGWYASLPEEEKEKGTTALPIGPPKQCDTLVSTLWDKHRAGWRELVSPAMPLDPAKSKWLAEKITRFADAPTLPIEKVDFDTSAPQSMTLTRSVRKRRGSIWQLPKDLKS